jgi:predicted kinase
MKVLYITRGLPGSGKSTFAQSLDCPFVEADMYFDHNGEYKFDPTKLRDAHNWCRNRVRDLMMVGTPKIAVSNTFTQNWEMETYYELAKEFCYTVFSVIVENRHDGTNTHNVSDETIKKMKDRFDIQL